MKLTRIGTIIASLVMVLASCTSNGGGQGQTSGGGAPTVSVSSAPKEPGYIISLEGGKVDNAAMTLYLFVEKEVSSVSLSQLISVTEGTSWKLYRGEQEIPTKIATSQGGSLVDGDNEFFVVASANGGLIENTYTLTIYRSFMVNVSYYHLGKMFYQDSVPTGHEYAVKSSFEIPGYSFGSITDKSGKTVQGKVTPWENLSYYIAAAPLKYGAILDPNGGTVENTSLEFVFDANYTLPDPTRKGYRFLGWFEGDTQFPQTGVWKKAKVINLTAHWEVIVYKISYDLLGGTNDSRNPSTYTVNDANISLYKPTKYGYDSLGWIDNEKAEITVIPKGSVGDVQLTANYRVQTYSITYLIDEETTNPNPDSYTIEDGIIHLNDPEKSGMGFYGWLNEDDEIVTDIDPKNLSNIVLRPCWGSPGLTINNGVLRSVSPKTIKTVIIPNTVTTIHDHAFEGCTSLTSVVIPDGVAFIPYQAFYGCSSLRFFCCKAESRPFKWDPYWNHGCSIIWGFEKVVTLDGLTYAIGKQGGARTATVVNNDSVLTDITIPESVDGATVTALGNKLFQNCSTLASITIPSTVTSIGSSVFSGCTSLTSIVIPEGVASIGTSAFSGCTSLASIKVPSSVTSIGTSAFYGCSSLTSIVIPDGVASIGASSFSGCSSLTSVKIPNSVASIRGNAFYGCSSLTSVEIPDGVAYIDGYTFYGCTSLASVKIPNSVGYIDDYAFYGCTSLASVKIPNSVRYIDDYAFYGCTSLTSVEISEGETPVASSTSIVASIGERAFQNCTSLVSVTIPKGVTSIEYRAFYGCSSLTAIVIPKGITSIGPGAFWGCTSLASIVISEGVGHIGDYAFYGCTSLTSAEIPNSVTSIGENAFGGCTSLTSVAIPKSAVSIERYAFYGCSSLTSVEIPDGVTSIGEYVFSGCSSLASVIIPTSVRSLRVNAFSNLDVKVFYRGTKKDWANIANYGTGPGPFPKVYFYAEEKPTEQSAYYWHFVHGLPEVW